MLLRFVMLSIVFFEIEYNVPNTKYRMKTGFGTVEITNSFPPQIHWNSRTFSSVLVICCSIIVDCLRWKLHVILYHEISLNNDAYSNMNRPKYNTKYDHFLNVLFTIFTDNPYAENLYENLLYSIACKCEVKYFRIFNQSFILPLPSIF